MTIISVNPLRKRHPRRHAKGCWNTSNVSTLCPLRMKRASERPMQSIWCAVSWVGGGGSWYEKVVEKRGGGGAGVCGIGHDQKIGARE